MLDSDEDRSSDESESEDSDEGTIMTIGRGREVECYLKETPKDAQGKHKRMKRMKKMGRKCPNYASSSPEERQSDSGNYVCQEKSAKR